MEKKKRQEDLPNGPPGPPLPAKGGTSTGVSPPPIGSSLRWDGGRQTTGNAISVALLHRMLHRSSLIRRSAPAVSLQLGPRAALTCHRHVIHSRAPASQPQGKPGGWSPLHPGIRNVFICPSSTASGPPSPRGRQGCISPLHLDIRNVFLCPRPCRAVCLLAGGRWLRRLTEAGDG